MQELKLGIYFQWQIGLCFSYRYGQINIDIPFMTIHLSLSKHAKGFEIFGKYFN